jgi:hypothetical protein
VTLRMRHIGWRYYSRGIVTSTKAKVMSHKWGGITPVVSGQCHIIDMVLFN